jgi:hypothetical protein
MGCENRAKPADEKSAVQGNMNAVVDLLTGGAAAVPEAAAGKPKEPVAAVKRRVGKTIDPAKVVTFDDWVKTAKGKYINVALGTDNSLLVLDPGKARDNMTEALATPVKTISHVMGADYSVVLRGGATEELRAAAEAKRNAVKTERDGLVSGYQTAFQTVETELLNAVDNWGAANDAPSRRVAALAVGRAARAAALAAADVRGAQYPYRYAEHTLTSRRLVYPALDDAELELVRYFPVATSAADRGVTVGGGAAIAGGAGFAQ